MKNLRTKEDGIPALFLIFYEGVGANMSDVVIVALITGGLTLVGTIITNAYTHKRVKAEQAQQTQLVLYRIEQLEKKVEKHNNLVERMFKVEERCQVIEEKIKVANHRISDLERDVS